MEKEYLVSKDLASIWRKATAEDVSWIFSLHNYEGEVAISHINLLREERGWWTGEPGRDHDMITNTYESDLTIHIGGKWKVWVEFVRKKQKVQN